MKVEDVVFEKRYEGELRWIPVDDIPAEYLQHGKEYKISLNIYPGYYSDNNSWDSYSEVEIIHLREQTEEEKQKFREFINKKKEENRKERYEKYLKLKEEFDENIQVQATL